jgi:ribose transport system permease protein
LNKLVRKETGIFVLLVVLCVVSAMKSPAFLTGENLFNLSRRVGMFGIFSIGSAWVIITSGIDLSVGSMFALLGVLMAIMLNDKHWNPVLSVFVIFATGSLLGLIHAFLITKVRIQPFIVTLCGLLIYRGAAQYISNDSSKGLGNAEGFEWLRDFVTGRYFGLPTPFILLIVIAIVMGVVLHRSVYGRHLFAAGRNEDAARYSGVNSNFVIGSAYVVSGFLASISAIFFLFDTNSVQASNHGNFYELYGIAAAVLGGCSLRGGEGTIVGVVLGTILLALLRNLINLLSIPSSLEFAVMGAVILVGVLADQLISRRAATRRATRG